MIDPRFLSFTAAEMQLLTESADFKEVQRIRQEADSNPAVERERNAMRGGTKALFENAAGANFKLTMPTGRLVTNNEDFPEHAPHPLTRKAVPITQLLEELALYASLEMYVRKRYQAIKREEEGDVDAMATMGLSGEALQERLEENQTLINALTGPRGDINIRIVVTRKQLTLLEEALLPKYEAGADDGDPDAEDALEGIIQPRIKELKSLLSRLESGEAHAQQPRKRTPRQEQERAPQGPTNLAGRSSRQTPAEAETTPENLPVPKEKSKIGAKIMYVLSLKWIRDLLKK